MNRIIGFLLVVVFSIFIGAQITEGILFVPYWQSMSPNEFHTFYNEFGSSIGKFFTILTITAAFIPVLLSIYCKFVKSKAFVYAAVSAFFAILFVSCFYIYFKGANEQFYQSVLSEVDLKNELITWGKWHWGRVVIECVSLVFLILALVKMGKSN